MKKNKTPKKRRNNLVKLTASLIAVSLLAPLAMATMVGEEALIAQNPLVREVFARQGGEIELVVHPQYRSLTRDEQLEVLNRFPLIRYSLLHDDLVHHVNLEPLEGLNRTTLHKFVMDTLKRDHEQLSKFVTQDEFFFEPQLLHQNYRVFEEEDIQELFIRQQNGENVRESVFVGGHIQYLLFGQYHIDAETRDTLLHLQEDLQGTHLHDELFRGEQVAPNLWRSKTHGIDESLRRINMVQRYTTLRPITRTIGQTFAPPTF